MKVFMVSRLLSYKSSCGVSVHKTFEGVLKTYPNEIFKRFGAPYYKNPTWFTSLDKDKVSYKCEEVELLD